MTRECRRQGNKSDLPEVLPRGLGRGAGGTDCVAAVCRDKMRTYRAAQPTPAVLAPPIELVMDVNRDPLQSQSCSRKLAALGAPERLRVVHFLRDGAKNVGEIADMLQTPAVNVTHHMHVLVEAGLVHREKRGRFVYYSLLPGVL